jgi:hypothetical protein
MRTNVAASITLEKLQFTLEKLQADGYSWYAEDGKTIEYELTEDIYQIQQAIAKKVKPCIQYSEAFCNGVIQGGHQPHALIISPESLQAQPLGVL